jgi:heat shock protein HslJ
MKRNTLFLLAAALSLAILMAGCTGSGTAPPLERTAWTLTEIRNDAGDLVPVLAGTEVTAEFSADGRVTGSAGCNRYFAGYSTSGNRISVTDAGSTMMFCGDPEGLMVQEALFLGQLAASTAFRIEGTKLTLLEVGARPLLVFRPGTG